jgi:hypothetical protein
MAERRDIASARRMTPEVRHFAAGPGETRMDDDRDDAPLAPKLTPDQHTSARPQTKLQTNDHTQPHDFATEFVPVNQSPPIEWKQYSGRLPAELLQAFKRLCLEREMLGLQPYRQQELLCEAVHILLRRYRVNP